MTMSGKDESNEVDRLLKRLADAESELEQEEAELFAHVAQDVETGGLQEDIISRYADFGRELLSDTSPGTVDVRIAGALKPILGDVSNVRIHSGKLATEAARAMDARAFAVGDGDIFIDHSMLDQSSTRGAALIAHEIAHTRDAATGFALSRSGGSGSTTAREQFADDVAATFVQGAGPQQSPPDERILTDMIVAILEKEEKHSRDRLGR
jgi:hypothetical protein